MLHCYPLPIGIVDEVRHGLYSLSWRVGPELRYHCDISELVEVELQINRTATDK